MSTRNPPARRLDAGDVLILATATVAAIVLAYVLSPDRPPEMPSATGVEIGGVSRGGISRNRRSRNSSSSGVRRRSLGRSLRPGRWRS